MPGWRSWLARSLDMGKVIGSSPIPGILTYNGVAHGQLLAQSGRLNNKLIRTEKRCPALN